MTFLLAAFYFAAPQLAEWIVSDARYAKYAGKDATRIVEAIQVTLLYPFGKWLSTTPRYFLVIPYYFFLFLGIRYLLGHFKKFWKITGIVVLISLILLYCFPGILRMFENDQASVSKGSVARGSIENAKRMYFRGKNFTTYSFPGYLVGRTYVHSQLRKAMVESYQACEQTCKDVTFVVGEIGSRKGGLFLPHRTHRNGLSVDFMTPMLKNGKSYRTHHLFNLWGYGLEFDDKGNKGSVSIDYETMAMHLIALEKAAKQNGLEIQKVIFDPVLRPYLLATPSGGKIKHLPYTKNRVIVRHDDHYHIDFKVR